MFALINTSPKLPLWPPIVNELAPGWPATFGPLLLLATYLWTDGSIMKHSWSALTNPSIESYLY